MARYQAADAERAVAKELVDQSVSAVKTAQAAVAAAEANVESNTANVHRLQELTSFERVVAPFAGTVIQRNVDVGDLITAGSPTTNTAAAPSSASPAPGGLFEVAQIDALRVFVNVPQAYAANIKPGRSGERPRPPHATGQGHGDPHGQCARSGDTHPAGGSRHRQSVARAAAGHVRLRGLHDWRRGARWRVPATAVVFDAQGTRVVVVGADSTLHFQPVVLGRDFGESIDVQAGLHGGETLVKQPTDRRLAEVQYTNGLVDYLLVIDAERTLLANQLALAQATSLQMNASIHLVKALAGGWQNRP
jgi:hypothetical protein